MSTERENEVPRSAPLPTTEPPAKQEFWIDQHRFEWPHGVICGAQVAASDPGLNPVYGLCYAGTDADHDPDRMIHADEWFHLPAKFFTVPPAMGGGLSTNWNPMPSFRSRIAQLEGSLLEAKAERDRLNAAMVVAREDVTVACDRELSMETQLAAARSRLALLEDHSARSLRAIEGLKRYWKRPDTADSIGYMMPTDSGEWLFREEVIATLRKELGLSALTEGQP